MCKANKLKQFLAKKRLYIFDLYHTLITLESSGIRGPSTAQRLGIDLQLWQREIMLNSHWRLKGEEKDPFLIMKKLLREMAPQIKDEKIREVSKIRQQRFHQALIDVPESTVDILRAIRQGNKEMVLLSNADAGENTGWQQSPLAPFFRKALFSCDISFMKPERESYLLALEAGNAFLEEAVFIGDGSCEELSGAKAIGLDVIMTQEHTAHLKQEELKRRSQSADFIIYSLQELL